MLTHFRSPHRWIPSKYDVYWQGLGWARSLVLAETKILIQKDKIDIKGFLC
jgi:hypothetical protein